MTSNLVYTVLVPRTDYHRSILTRFMDQLWSYYGRVKSYGNLTCLQRTEQEQAIKDDFTKLFLANTDYAALNKIMLKTRQKEVKLLAFVDYPAFPVHNNMAERGARRVVRKRDVSFHTWSERGTRARDAFMSLHQTANKLGVSFMDYLVKRNSGIKNGRTIAELVTMAYSPTATAF